MTRRGQRPLLHCCGVEPIRQPPRHPRYGRSCELAGIHRSEEHTSELQSLRHLVCRLLLEKNRRVGTRGGSPEDRIGGGEQGRDVEIRRLFEDGGAAYLSHPFFFLGWGGPQSSPLFPTARFSR